jgi:hypothetical protein
LTRRRSHITPTAVHRRPARALALGIALLWAAVPILDDAHAGNGHRYCAQHQALEELPAFGPARSEPADNALSTAPDGLAAEHRACPFALATAGSVGRETTATVAAAPVSDAPATPPAAPPPGAAVLDLAPKTSPPPLAV